MDLDLVFFGTSGSVPTAQRAPSALLVRRGGERLLVDCAEGTQRQLLRSAIGLVELREVFLTHYHADHYLGLPGMLKTFALRGREVVLTGDTTVSPAVLEAARGADVLVHEATFLDEERDRARETAHSTALEAAELARDADVALLALTHLSNRYFGPELAREACAIFPETVVPKDFDIIDVPFRERGSPRLVKGGALHRREEHPAPEPEVVP